MDMTTDNIKAFLSENYPQIELLRGKHGFYLSGALSTNLSHNHIFWKKLSDIDQETLEREARALSLSVADLKERITNLETELAQEKQKLQKCLDTNEVIDPGYFNTLIEERNSIKSHLKAVIKVMEVVG